MSRFLAIAQFREKCTEWPPNDLDMFVVKSIHIHATYTHKAQMFISFALQWAVFELRTKIEKSAQNELDTFKVKVPTCIPHTPRGPTFRPFRSTMGRFWARNQLW